MNTFFNLKIVFLLKNIFTNFECEWAFTCCAWGWEKAGSLPVSRELSLARGYLAATEDSGWQALGLTLADSPLASPAGVWCFRGGFVLLGLSMVHEGTPRGSGTLSPVSLSTTSPSSEPVCALPDRLRARLSFPWLLGCSCSLPSAGSSWSVSVFLQPSAFSLCSFS